MSFQRQSTPPSAEMRRQESKPGFLPGSMGSEGSGSFRSPKMNRKASNLVDSGDQNVKVVCRVRPFARREIEIQEEFNAKFQNAWDKQPLRSVIEMEGNTTIFLDYEREFKEKERFHFDISCWSIPPDQQRGTNPFCSQKDVMDQVGTPSVKALWTGFNTCIFAYGQTGSGKTYTMMGTEDQVGLTPRICQALFRELENKREEDEQLPVDGTVREYRLEARFLEVYNEKVKDLLWGIRPDEQPTEGFDKDNLRLRNIPGQGPMICGITTIVVDKSEDCMKLIEEGTRHRSVAATKMNDTSSRSHSIFRLTLVQTTKVLPTRQFERPKCYDKVSCISLVDLAGSERQKKTESTGQRLREAININLSLTTLKNVIDALVEGRVVIPFRDSNLTWLLSDNLGGNSKTFMISCVSPHWDNAEETLNTCRYALRAQGIVNHARVNETEEMRRFNKMKEELARLHKEFNANPNEERLKHQIEDSKARMRVMQYDALQKEQEADEIERHMEFAKEMQKNAAYHHAFREVFYRRLEKIYHEMSIELKENQHFAQQEVEQLEMTVLAKEAQTQAIAIEEKVARENKEAVDARVTVFREELQTNERRVRDLTDMEDHLKESALAKMTMLPEARKIGRLVVEWAKHRSALEIEEAAKQIREETEEMEGKAYKSSQELKVSLADNQKRLEDERQHIQAKIGAMKQTIVEFEEWSTQRIRELNSTCIFFENEKKRLFDDLQKSLVSVNNGWYEKFYTTKEKLGEEINKFNAVRREKVNKAAGEVRMKKMARERETHEKMEEAEKKSQDEYGKTVVSFERKLAAADDTWRKKLSQLTALNVDIGMLLREASVRQPRYLKLYDKIVDLCDNPPHDADAKMLLDALKGAEALLQSNAPHTFRSTAIAEVTVCNPAPHFGVEEQKDPAVTPSRELAAREHAAPFILFAPYAVLPAESPDTRQANDFKTVVSKLAALTPPPKMPAQTKTSRLRESSLLYRRGSGVPSSNASQTGKPFTRQERATTRKIKIGETYLVTRTKSPAAGDFIPDRADARRSPSAPVGSHHWR